MPTALRFLTFPEVLANMFAHARTPQNLGSNADLIPGSGVRTTLECAALSDAEQYVQMSRLLNLFSLDKCRGDDLDQRAVEIGSDILTSLRRRPASTSVTDVVVGNGTFLQNTTLSADALYGAATFTVANPTGFPVSGAITISASTANEEDLIYTRVGAIFTVVLSGTSAVLRRSHAAGEPVVSVSIRSTLASLVNIGATTATLLAGTGAAWTSSGTIIFDRSTTTQEKIAFTRIGDVLTLGAATTFAHAAGAVVIQSTDGTDHAITAGSQGYVPPTLSSAQITFATTQAGTLYDGDFVSGLIPMESLLVGSATRVGSNQITKWTTPPFSGATITNPASATRGSAREEDDDFRQRLKDFLQSLTRGTPLSITTFVKGLTDPDTGAKIAFCQIVEPVLPGRSLLYITDGTLTFSLAQQPFLGRDVIISDAAAGDARGKLGTYGPPYNYSSSPPYAPRLFSSASTTRGASTSVGSNFLEDTTQAMATNAFAGMWLKSVDNVFRLVASNTAVRFVFTSGDIPSAGSYSLYNFATPLVPGTDFNFNPATGDLELTTSLGLHDGLVAASDGASPSTGAYLYSSGLAAFTQRSVNGDPSDFNDFPGYRSAGTQVLVVAPMTQAQAYIIAIVPARGFTVTQLTSPVQIAVETYVNALGIGATQILSEVIAAIMALPGVADATIIFPTGNVTVPSGTLNRIGDSDIAVV